MNDAVFPMILETYSPLSQPARTRSIEAPLVRFFATPSSLAVLQENLWALSCSAVATAFGDSRNKDVSACDRLKTGRLNSCGLLLPGAGTITNSQGV
jgi:hypothetical protein